MTLAVCSTGRIKKCEIIECILRLSWRPVYVRGGATSPALLNVVLFIGLHNATMGG